MWPHLIVRARSEPVFMFSADGKDRTSREAFGTLAPEGSLSDGGYKT